MNPTGLKFSILTLIIILGTATLTESAFSKKNKAEGEKVFLCYWGTWSIYRSNQGYTFNTQHINPHQCTHLLYSFAGLNNQTYKIGSLDPWCDYASGECETMENGDVHCGGLNNLRLSVGLKSQNPNLKVLIAIGGWNQGSKRFSDMAADPEKRATFIQSVVEFITRFELDGLDMDWEYPVGRDGAPEDYDNFPILLQELRAAFDEAEGNLGRELVLASAVAAGIETIEEAYNIPEISRYLDYINIMAYDLKVYVANESELIGHHSPLFPKEWEDPGNQSLTVSAAVQYYLDHGAPAEKLVLGIAAYGKTWEIDDSVGSDFYDQAAGPGAAQAVSQTAGTIFYNELCQTENRYDFYFDYDYLVPYATDGDIWIGYDNIHSTIHKVDFAFSKGLGGLMIWSIDSDDFSNFCGSLYSRHLGNTIKNRMDYHANSTKSH